MTRYLRAEIQETGIVADPQAIDRELQRAAEAFNGDIDGLQIEENIVVGDKIVASACNLYFIENSPFGVGTFTLQRKDITSRDWTYPTDGVIEWTADEDGVVAGEFEFTIRYYGQAISSENFGWSVGIFIDGVLAGRTDKIQVQFYCGGLPFHQVVTKGAHTLRLGILAYSYSASAAADPEDVVTVYSSQIFWRLAKR